jgi:hypothetical protein
VLQLQGWAGLVAAIPQVVYLGAAFALAWQLFARARRSRDFAPLLLGVQLLFAMGLGYALCGAGMALAMLPAEIGLAPGAKAPALVAALLALGHGSTIVGLAAALWFERRVFWPDARWALALIGFLVAAMATGWLGATTSGAFATGSYANGWVQLLTAGMLATNLWVGIEPLVYHAKLAKRVPLGLAEPLVADRFLLWGLGSLARALLILMGPAAEALLGVLGAGDRGAFSAATLFVASGLGLATSVAYWLTFEPTAAYVRWVERRYAVAAPR